MDVVKRSMDERLTLNAEQFHVATDVATKPVATEFERKVLRPALRDAVTVKPSDVARVQKWREANREKYNKRMREYRRAKKAGAKPLGIAHG